MSQDLADSGVGKCSLCGLVFRERRWAIRLNDRTVHPECARVTLDEHWGSFEWGFYGTNPQMFHQRLNAWRLKVSRINLLISRDEEKSQNREYRREELNQFINRLANVDKWLATFLAYRRGDSACAARALDDLEEAIQELLDSDRGRNLLDRRIVEKAKVAQ